jgi:glycosyltransferase involved in cell wall biosynthesis
MASIHFAMVLRAEPSVYLLLVGWFDAAEDAVERGIRGRIEGHPRIICTGFVTDTAPYYRAMDLLILPTWREGFPNAVLEAAASGVPADAVVPEVTGLLVPPGYPEAICESSLKLLRDPERRLQMGRAARGWVGEHYDDRRVIGLMTGLYKGLMSHPVGKREGAKKGAAKSPTDLPVLP